MIVDLALIFGGLFFLVIAGDALVRGAVALSLRIGLSALLVSLTVVAFGTSAPELLVGIKATLDGSTGLVYGNVVGSNIANVFLVLGAPLLIASIPTGRHGVRRNYAMMAAATLLFIAVCGYGGVNFWMGVAFLALLGALIFDAYAMARKDPALIDFSELEEAPTTAPRWKIAGLILAGVIGLPIGARILIDGAQSIAIAFGISEAAIGLTLVAVGTSLPELATTVMAAVRRHADVAVGNVIGSNLFNILAVMGGAALFGELPTPPGFFRLDLWVMLAATLALAPYIFLGRDLNRATGAFFLTAYFVYIIFALGPRM